MNTVDSITREVKTVVDSSKDNATSNIIKAAKSGIINMSDSDLSKIVNIVEISVTEGYQRSVPNFQKSIKKYLNV